MTARRRKWLLAATLLVIAAALAWVFLRGAGKMEVKLIHVGYTNGTYLVGDELGGREVPMTEKTKALVVLSNSGATKIDLCYVQQRRLAIEDGEMTQIFTIWQCPGTKNLPKTLPPGESLLLIGPPHSPDEPWMVEIGVARNSARDRLSWYLSNSKPSFVRNLFAQALPLPPIEKFTFSPITNLPPAAAAPDLPRVARP